MHPQNIKATAIRIASALIKWANSAQAKNDRVTRWCLLILLASSPGLLLGSLIGSAGSCPQPAEKAEVNPSPSEIAPSPSPSPVPSVAPSPIIWVTPKPTPTPKVILSPSPSPTAIAREPVSSEPPISEPVKPAWNEPIREPYQGSCECPYDTDRRGRRCGGRSAYSRAGGSPGMCYR